MCIGLYFAVCRGDLSALRCLAVHRLQPAVRVGQGRRHVHFTADDFDIGPGLVSAG